MRRSTAARTIPLLVLTLGPALSLLLATAPVAATEDPLTPAERAWIEAHGPIRYAPDPDYPPFEWVDDEGNVTGINVDLLNRMSRNLGVEFEVRHYENWTAVLAALQEGEVDLLGSAAATPDREPYADFVGPYMQVGEVFYVRTDNPATRPEDLVGQRVAVIENYAAAMWLKEHYPQLTTVPVPDIETGLTRLSVGEVDAFFENIPVGGYYIRERALNNVRILGEPLFFSDANWVVPEGNEILAAIIEKGMASISPGEQTKVFEYWTGYDLGIRAAAPTPQGISPLALNLILGVLAVATLSGAWSLSLRRTVASRTQDLKEANRRLEDMNAQLASDVAARLAAEREVRTLNEELERRVAARTRELARANEDLEAFSYTVSHDLRTPLSSLSNYAEVVRRKYGDNLGKEGGRYVERIQAAAARMTQLTEDMLRLSRATRLPLEVGRVDLSALAASVVAGLKDRDPARQVTVSITPGLRAEGDARLLRIALENLLENAWKYTRGTADARIEVRGEQTPSGVRVEVKDNGVGFDPALASRLFTPFQRLHDPKQFEGTGVGLSTVRRILERHGGTIGATAAPGEGATFTFTLGAAP
ncbi:MAG TPA: transporter substrate-binding domain-containing protein [Candidatus Thermoplasmatota archaeon]|nr:transporter substrate-binding domain-containing protein [Candidatus Thermoplasmatota archaeon]